MNAAIIEKMTAPQLIKLAIIDLAIEWGQLGAGNTSDISTETIDDLYDEYKGDSLLDDCDNETRTSGNETGLPCDMSRHYDSESVAINVRGVWVGFTEWSGGGKHGEPEAIDWIDSAYFVEAKPIIVTRHEFSLIK